VITLSESCKKADAFDEFEPLYRFAQFKMWSAIILMMSSKNCYWSLIPAVPFLSTNFLMKTSTVITDASD